MISFLLVEAIKRDFFSKYPIHTQKVNERPWGAYSLAISFEPPHGFMDSNDIFGWGWEPEVAAANIIVRHTKSENPHFKAFIGEERMNALLAIMKTHPTDDVPTAEMIAVVPPSTTATGSGSITE